MTAPHPVSASYFIRFAPKFKNRFYLPSRVLVTSLQLPAMQSHKHVGLKNSSIVWCYGQLHWFDWREPHAAKASIEAEA